MNNNENFNVLNPLGAWNNTRLYRAQVIYTQAVSLPAYISCPFVTYGGSLYYSTGFDINYNELQPTQGLIPSQDPAWLLVNITGGGGGLPTITSPTGTILVTGTLQNPNIDLPQSVATSATPTFAGLNISYTTQERSILKKMLSLFTTDDVQAVFNASIRTGVLTANRVVTIPDGDSVTVVATTAQAGKVVSYIGADGIQRFVNNGGGGLGAYRNTFFTYTYTTSDLGQFPLTFTLTDQTFPIPTGWNWVVGGLGVSASDSAFINGTTASSRNPQIVFTPQKAYTLTLTPTSTDPTISYFPYILEIPPVPVPFLAGDFSSIGFFNNPANFFIKPFYNYSSTDALVITSALLNRNLSCQLVTSAVISGDQLVVPTITVSPIDINSTNAVTSSPILTPSFPATYFSEITALMLNSDGTTTSQTEQSNLITYYVPAFYIQNQFLTAPTFDTTANQVSQANYQIGQNILIRSGNDLQVIWVAFPKTFTNSPGALVVDLQKGYTGLATIISNTSVPQIIGLNGNNFSYNIYGYQVGFIGNSTYGSRLYLEEIPTIIDAPVANTDNLLIKPAIETPKLGFFQRLFGAKS